MPALSSRWPAAALFSEDWLFFFWVFARRINSRQYRPILPHVGKYRIGASRAADCSFKNAGKHFHGQPRLLRAGRGQGRGHGECIESFSHPAPRLRHQGADPTLRACQGGGRGGSAVYGTPFEAGSGKKSLSVNIVKVFLPA